MIPNSQSGSEINSGLRHVIERSHGISYCKNSINRAPSGLQKLTYFTLEQYSIKLVTRTPEYRWWGLMSKSVQFEVFVQTGKTVLTLSVCRFELFIKIPANDLKKVGRFFQNMFGLAPSGLPTYIQRSLVTPSFILTSFSHLDFYYFWLHWQTLTDTNY